MNKPSIQSVVKMMEPVGLRFHEVVLNVDVERKEPFWDLIGKCREEASVIDHVVQGDDRQNNVFKVRLIRPKLDALKSLHEIGRPSVEEFTVEETLATDADILLDVLPVLERHVLAHISRVLRVLLMIHGSYLVNVIVSS